MADAGKDHLEFWGTIGAGLIALLGGCRAMLYRRKRPPSLSEEQMIHIEARVLTAVREQIADELSQQAANIRVLEADVIDLRGELRRRQR